MTSVVITIAKVAAVAMVAVIAVAVAFTMAVFTSMSGDFQ